MVNTSGWRTDHPSKKTSVPVAAGELSAAENSTNLRAWKRIGRSCNSCPIHSGEGNILSVLEPRGFLFERVLGKTVFRLTKTLHIPGGAGKGRPGKGPYPGWRPGSNPLGRWSRCDVWNLFIIRKAGSKWIQDEDSKVQSCRRSYGKGEGSGKTIRRINLQCERGSEERNHTKRTD